MRIFTTPTLTLQVEGVDLTGEDHVAFSLSDPTESHVVTKEDNALTLTKVGSDTKVSMTLTQAESGSFKPNKMGKAEVNWWNNSGTSRGATEIVDIPIKNNILKKVKPDV